MLEQVGDLIALAGGGGPWRDHGEVEDAGDLTDYLRS